MPYKEEETETVLPFRGGFRRGSWNARRALLRPLYCLLVGDNISVLLSALGTPFGAPGTARRALGTVLPRRGVREVLERAKRSWNALWASGTEPPALSGTRASANGTPEGPIIV